MDKFEVCLANMNNTVKGEDVVEFFKTFQVPAEKVCTDKDSDGNVMAVVEFTKLEHFLRALKMDNFKLNGTPVNIYPKKNVNEVSSNKAVGGDGGHDWFRLPQLCLRHYSPPQGKDFEASDAAPKDLRTSRPVQNVPTAWNSDIQRKHRINDSSTNKQDNLSTSCGVNQVKVESNLATTSCVQSYVLSAATSTPQLMTITSDDADIFSFAQLVLSLLKKMSAEERKSVMAKISMILFYK